MGMALAANSAARAGAGGAHHRRACHRRRACSGTPRYGDFLALRSSRQRRAVQSVCARENKPSALFTRADYAHAPQVFYNTLHPRGNTLNNLAQFYSNGIHVASHIPATTASGLDWKSLWQVWQPYKGNWYLVALAGDRWTF
jgi:hypothetical protein